MERLDEYGISFEVEQSTQILVENLPIIPIERHEEFKHRLRQIFGEAGEIRDLWIPLDIKTDESLGNCFVKYSTPEEATFAQNHLNGHQLDTMHKLLVRVFHDAFNENSRDIWQQSYYSWILDEKAREQFLIQDTEISVFWMDGRLWYEGRKPTLELFWSRYNCEQVQWSPQGGYLVTVNARGAVIYGGTTSLHRLLEFPQVNFIEFSPDDQFVTTYGEKTINIFKASTRKFVSSFERTKAEEIIRWSLHGKYFARLLENGFKVYETETFNQFLELENVDDCSWSPTNSVLALFARVGENQSARVSLLKIPSQVELQGKNLYDVDDCQMYWQCYGEYLAVKADRNAHTALEFFRVKEQGIPIEVLELNERIIAFAWEPKGHRFAVIHGVRSSPNVSFYSMCTSYNSKKISKLMTLEKKNVNSLFWSPNGRFIILAGLEELNGNLLFYDVDDFSTMAETSHLRASYIEWDPSGRFLVTAVTNLNPSFNIWSVIGKLLYQREIQNANDNILKFLWRPRASFLTGQKEKELGKNIEKYQLQYEEDDRKFRDEEDGKTEEHSLTAIF